MAEVVLGLDAGTSSAKAVAVDRTGTVLAEGASDPIITRSTPGGGSEQNPDDIWRALTVAARRVVDSLEPGCRVVAVAVGAQSGSVLPVTAGESADLAVADEWSDLGATCDRVITWMDTRSEQLVSGWSATVGARIRAVSGWAPTTGVGLATISWCRREPQAHLVTRWASVDDYLMGRLCGRWVTNPSNAAGMQLIDVTSGTWSDELCSLAGIDVSTLSSILPSGTVAGSLSAEAAAEMRLDAGMPVVVGGHDQACAAVALGVESPGDLLLSAGTAWVLTVVIGTPEVDALPPELNLSAHVVPGCWTASQNLGGLGAVLAETSPSRLPQQHRACATRVRQCLEAVGEMVTAGRELILVGGGTRSQELVEAIAGAIDRPVTARPDTAWPALGAARLAAVAVGWPSPSARL